MQCIYCLFTVPKKPVFTVRSLFGVFISPVAFGCVCDKYPAFKERICKVNSSTYGEGKIMLLSAGCRCTCGLIAYFSLKNVPLVKVTKGAVCKVNATRFRGFVCVFTICSLLVRRYVFIVGVHLFFCLVSICHFFPSWLCCVVHQVVPGIS